MELRKGELAVVVARKGQGKTTLARHLLPSAIILSPVKARRGEGRVNKIVAPDKGSVAAALAWAVGKGRDLIVDDADSLYRYNPQAIDHVAAHVRNYALRLVLVAKTPVRFSPFIHDCSDWFFYRPGHAKNYIAWTEERGLPARKLNPFWFYATDFEGVWVTTSRFEKWINFEQATEKTA